MKIPKRKPPTKTFIVGNIGRIPAEPCDKRTPEKIALGRPHYSAPSDDWMVNLRSKLNSYEEAHWQGLNDGTMSRQFVPTRMRLVKHFMDLYDSAVAHNHVPRAAVMEARLKRLAIDPTSRWGGLA